MVDERLYDETTRSSEFVSPLHSETSGSAGISASGDEEHAAIPAVAPSAAAGLGAAAGREAARALAAKFIKHGGGTLDIPPAPGMDHHDAEANPILFKVRSLRAYLKGELGEKTFEALYSSLNEQRDHVPASKFGPLMKAGLRAALPAEPERVLTFLPVVVALFSNEDMLASSPAFAEL